MQLHAHSIELGQSVTDTELRPRSASYNSFDVAAQRAHNKIIVARQCIVDNVTHRPYMPATVGLVYIYIGKFQPTTLPLTATV